MSATETFKPFVQLATQTCRVKNKLTDDGGGTLLSQKVTDTSVLFGVGVEWAFLPSTAALQSSVMFGSEFLGHTEFRNELIIGAGEGWFGRISVIANTDSDVVMGFGGGISW